MMSIKRPEIVHYLPILAGVRNVQIKEKLVAITPSPFKIQEPGSKILAGSQDCAMVTYQLFYIKFVLIIINLNIF